MQSLLILKIFKHAHGDRFFVDTVYIRITHTHTHNPFTALFLGPPGWAGARRKLLDFMVQGKINRQTHRPSGWAPPLCFYVCIIVNDMITLTIYTVRKYFGSEEWCFGLVQHIGKTKLKAQIFLAAQIMLTLHLAFCLQCCALFIWHQKEHRVCKKCEVLAWLSVWRDVPLPPHHLLLH